MLELVDRTDLKSVVSNDVWVQVPPAAHMMQNNKIKKGIDKKQSILVLLIMSILSLLVLSFSLKAMDRAKDLYLEASITSISTLLMEYHIKQGFYPEEGLCNLKNECFDFKREISIYVDQDIYYMSNKKDYILYSPSYLNKRIYYMIDSDFSLKKVRDVPTIQ